MLVAGTETVEVRGAFGEEGGDAASVEVVAGGGSLGAAMVEDTRNGK